MLLKNHLRPNRKKLLKSKRSYSQLFDTSALNPNKLIDGLRSNRATASNAITIQDLIKRLNGSGLKVTYMFFFFY